ncbi:DUF3738 domain-containing protein [Ginsengibacter hankyongi]|uniref:DUF3738 domain-containing protein n=1 Tax=Ginsengibacter hankyongi TaxID=2607284 RepID=A0A5J5IIH5_9BACT|nr:thioredoxin domain-containing protein [Ginsengibacter hankyongi]KAA9040830.1 DUF3738 domain-containing protein [Ginsengibacter hankyongi]
MKLIIGILAMLLPVLSTAQPATIKPLTVGDKVPGITIESVFNYPSSSIQLSRPKSQLTVIDFWATWCGSCVGTFSKMHALKKEFGDSLQIFFIDADKKDTPKKVSAFFESRKKRTAESFTLPYVLQDSVMEKLFPHQTIPHCVWLDSALRVIAITGHEQVTGGNIKKYLSGSILHLPVKNDVKLFNREKPLLVDENGGEAPGDFIYRSVITGYKDGLGMSLGKFQNSDYTISAMYIINYPLYHIFQMAYPDVLQYDAKRIFIEAKDSLLFVNDSTKQHLFCYEITTPPVSQQKINEYLQSDLERTFHAVARKEMRDIDCYILTANNNISKCITKGGAASIDINEKSLRKYINNTSPKVLAEMLDNLLDKPVIDESGFTGNIDMVFPGSIYHYTPAQVISFLAAKGFTVSVASRKIAVGVIAESNN